FSRDWSSDVCSSDLLANRTFADLPRLLSRQHLTEQTLRQLARKSGRIGLSKQAHQLLLTLRRLNRRHHAQTTRNIHVHRERIVSRATYSRRRRLSNRLLSEQARNLLLRLLLTLPLQHRLPHGLKL